jgi:hypothetical protein
MFINMPGPIRLFIALSFLLVVFLALVMSTTTLSYISKHWMTAPLSISINFLEPFCMITVSASEKRNVEMRLKTSGYH